MDTSTVTDPVLLRVLAVAQQTRAHCLSMLAFLEGHKQTTPTPSQEDTVALSKLQKQLVSHLSLTRGAHRNAVFAARQSKSLTAASKSEIDSLHLSLQNLFYEQRHLLGEIAACADYPHVYTKLALQDRDGFLARYEGKEDAAVGFKEGIGEHELMLARIKDERRERQRLEKERVELVKVKQEKVKRNQKMREELDKLDKEVEAWFDGRSKIERTFEDKLGKEIRTADGGMEVDA